MSNTLQLLRDLFDLVIQHDESQGAVETKKQNRADVPCVNSVPKELVTNISESPVFIGNKLIEPTECKRKNEVDENLLYPLCDKKIIQEMSPNEFLEYKKEVFDALDKASKKKEEQKKAIEKLKMEEPDQRIEINGDADLEELVNAQEQGQIDTFKILNEIKKTCSVDVESIKKIEKELVNSGNKIKIKNRTKVTNNSDIKPKSMSDRKIAENAGIKPRRKK